jgi:iron complex outermembrane receptor protein
MNQYGYLLSIVLAATGALYTAPVVAAEETKNKDTVEEVIITAQKVAQDQQTVPIATSVFTEEQLRVNRMEAMVDVAQRTPGMVANEVNPAEPNIAIRGIGTEGIDSNAAGDASVVTFMDGVYVGRGGGANLDLLDLERVEVLRGPQGTLFGKNVVGGLVNLVSRLPTDENFADIAVSYGNYNQQEIRGRINRVLSDRVSLAAGVISRQHDGYTENQTTGNDVDDEDIAGMRAALLINASDVLDFIIRGDLTQQEQAGKPRDNVCNAAFNGGVHCIGVSPDPREVNAIIDGSLDRKVAGVSLETNWTIDAGTITSITAYRQAHFNFEDPFFSNPVNPPTQIESINRNIEDSYQISEELRIAFTAMDDRLDGIAGVYYLYEQVNRNEWLKQLFPAPALTGIAAFPQDVDSTSAAIFGEVGYNVLDTLELIVGARMTLEQKDVDLAGILVAGPGTPPPLSVPYNVSNSENWDAFTPRFVVEWTVTDEAMVYASAARGFKSGGYQGTAGTGASASTPYDPEYAWSYELGAKTQWFEDKVRVNAAAYHVDYEDLQVSSLVPLCCVVIGNAAEAEIDGFEIEVVGRPLPGLELNSNHTWLNAEYTDFPPTTATGVNFAGNKLQRAPENKTNIGAQYTVPVSNDLEWFVRVDYTQQSKMYFEASNTPNEVQPSYDLWGGRVAVRAPDGSWEFAVWGKNLTDELVKTHIVAFAPFQQQLNTYQAPRTYGATVTFHW